MATLSDHVPLKILPWLALNHVRSAGYVLEGQVLFGLSRLLFKAERSAQDPDWATFVKIQRGVSQLLRRDAQNVADGIYPGSVFRPEHPFRHLKRVPRVILDGIKIASRRKQGKTTEFSQGLKESLDELPRYYRRNFHFQTDGYLSQESAELYEHEVELLFSGTADAMRRMIIPELRKSFGSSDGKGLRFLEVAAGTGRATRFVSLAFPKAKIVALDLSAQYLKQAQKKLKDRERIDFVQGNATDLPFQDEHFDAVYSVFLYHELPEEERRKVLSESLRVLKKDGVLGLVDSIQQGDSPDFDTLLPDFPRMYHEPFYRNYIENKMEGMLEAAGFKEVSSAVGFLSKAVWGVKHPANAP
jgi:ubiquinone/menaquinone biosynthesis C-methylase UbiE